MERGERETESITKWQKETENRVDGKRKEREIYIAEMQREKDTERVTLFVIWLVCNKLTAIFIVRLNMSIYLYYLSIYF